MEKSAIALRILPTIIFAMMIAACSAAGPRSAERGNFIHTIVGQEWEHVAPSADKVWEGEIGGKLVAYFRLQQNSTFKDVIVVTEDDLPEHFRSIEYCDSNGDHDLDLINIKMYEEGTGWKDIRITENNTSTLNQANTEYHELLKKIADLRMKDIDY